MIFKFGLFILSHIFVSDLIECKLYPIAVRLPLNGTAPNIGGSLWPQPTELKSTSEFMFIDRDLFEIDLSQNLDLCEKDIIEKIWQRYKNILFPPKFYHEKPEKNDLQVKRLIFDLEKNQKKIQIKDLNSCPETHYPFIQDTESESYVLNVDKNYGKLISKTVWGLIKGLESFSQLTYVFPNTNKLAINKTNLIDRPRFYHRGIMIDTARHFQPIPLLKKHLDTMLYNKMNVFHWHLVDDQSFPFESEAYPKLHEKGAFSSKHVYSKNEIKDLIEFARIRGIRIIPELDSPGHTYSWGLSYPELITVCWNNGLPLQSIYDKHGEREVLNPINEFTYEFLNNLIMDFKKTFKDQFIHLGMDEVYYRCWESNPNISQWMVENNYNTTKQVEQYFMNRILTLTKKMNYKSILWQDVWENGVKVFNDSILQIWKTSVDNTWQMYVRNATLDGYTVILSSPWYLNYIKYGSDWYDFYKVDPHDFDGNEKQKNSVIGGEACMWSEFVDGTNSISRLWPRASAVAERLWSSKNVNDVEEAKFRLDEFRCRMLKRGIEAAPIFNSYCGDYERYMDKSVLEDPAFNYYTSKSNNLSYSLKMLAYICFLICLINSFI